MDTNERHDLEISRAWAQNMALEVALIALLRSHPDRQALAIAWKDAEDMGFTWTSDAAGIDATRVAAIQSEYVAVLARLRAAALPD